MRYAIVEAPSTLGLGRAGVDQLPAALRGAGLADRLPAHHHRTVTPPSHLRRRDSATGLLDPDLLVAYSIELADALGPLLDGEDIPLVLGGDCSILLGSALALARRGRSGLLFVDGHTDFYSPETEPEGEAASMDLALVTGRGPAVVTDLEGHRPMFRDQDVVAFGFRDPFADPEYAAPPLPDRIRAFDLERIRTLGIADATGQALAHLTRPDGPGRFWLHVDVDVLDDHVMPAVDYRMPGGLSVDELVHVLGAAVTSGRLRGVEVTIFDPNRDPAGDIARELTEALIAGLGSRILPCAGTSRVSESLATMPCSRRRRDHADQEAHPRAHRASPATARGHRPARRGDRRARRMGTATRRWTHSDRRTSRPGGRPRGRTANQAAAQWRSTARRGPAG